MGVIKINVDGAVDVNNGRGRAGLVAQDSNGVVVGAAMELSRRAASVRVIEAAGFRFAVLTALNELTLHHS
ncbi:hypothetical protein RHMOL_Rhmol03G0195800 [Rhododendron molle]|uniref:Uncharacterized protein n=1 Tax=Rhododendron molle TaxID=49168 RepID=A0ACC0PHW3_RHOML|nr:hypothetical protein RHMOL_Rhmol03G0195800 [Rhododendron molle]